jgi:hypothetical protein
MRLFGAKEGIDADNNRKEDVQLHASRYQSLLKLVSVRVCKS